MGESRQQVAAAGAVSAISSGALADAGVSIPVDMAGALIG
jgi:hypothetical protein